MVANLGWRMSGFSLVGKPKAFYFSFGTQQKPSFGWLAWTSSFLKFPVLYQEN